MMVLILSYRIKIKTKVKFEKNLNSIGMFKTYTDLTVISVKKKYIY